MGSEDDEAPPDVRRFTERRDALEMEHARLMARLCSEIARDRGLGPFNELPDASRQLIISDATIMCENWSRDQALRDSHAAGVNGVVDLVALQHQIVEQIEAAEKERIAAMGASGRPARRRTPR